MSQFAKNSTDFGASCVQHEGLCPVDRDNILFLDDANELAALHQLQSRCGSVVIMRDATNAGSSLLYHTSCRRMTDVVLRIFEERMSEPVSIPQPRSEMMLGELHRRQISLSWDDCRSRVDSFAFEGASPG